MKLDPGMNLRKRWPGVPVGVGQPTMKLEGLTLGEPLRDRKAPDIKTFCGGVGLT